MQKFCKFVYLKLTFFYFILLFLQNTHISFYIIHIYSNKIFIFRSIHTHPATTINPVTKLWIQNRFLNSKTLQTITHFPNTNLLNHSSFFFFFLLHHIYLSTTMQFQIQFFSHFSRTTIWAPNQTIFIAFQASLDSVFFLIKHLPTPIAVCARCEPDITATVTAKPIQHPPNQSSQSTWNPIKPNHHPPNPKRIDDLIGVVWWSERPSFDDLMIWWSAIGMVWWFIGSSGLMIYGNRGMIWSNEERESEVRVTET